MSVAPSKSGEAEVIVIVKAAPQRGQKHGETVCCAGIDLQGNWLRLYPVAFRTLEDGQKFGRWDRIHFRWRLPNDDRRPESRRVDQDSIRVVGELPQRERQQFLAARIVTSLNRERAAKRSLALLKAQILQFSYERKSDKEIQSERANFAALRNQSDLFNTKPLIPYEPAHSNSNIVIKQRTVFAKEHARTGRLRRRFTTGVRLLEKKKPLLIFSASSEMSIPKRVCLWLWVRTPCIQTLGSLTALFGSTM